MTARGATAAGHQTMMFVGRLTARCGSGCRSQKSLPLVGPRQLVMVTTVCLVAAVVRLTSALPVEHYSALQDAAAAADEDLSQRVAALERLCSEPSDEATRTSFCAKMAVLLRGGYAQGRQTAWARDDDYHYVYNYAPASEREDRVFKRYQPLYLKRASFLRCGRAPGSGASRRFAYGDD